MALRSAGIEAALSAVRGVDAGLDAYLDLPFAPAGTRTFGHGGDRGQVVAAGGRAFGHGEDRDRAVAAGGRTFVVPAGNRKHRTG